MGRFAVLVGALLCFGGCKESREAALEREIKQSTGAQDVEVAADGKRIAMSHKSKCGESELEVGEQARIPDDFPSTIPIYPGSKVLTGAGMTDRGKRSHIVKLSAPAGAAAVYDFYKQRLPQFGKLDELALGKLRMLSAKNTSGTTVRVLLKAISDGETTVQLTTTAS